jgi:hypothetical protein
LAVQSDVAEPVSQPAKPEKTAAKPADAKKPADTKKPAAPAADEEKEEETEFPGWGAVLEILGALCHPLYGVLQGSSAYLRGDFVLIDTDNELFKSLVVRDGNKKVLAEAIKQVTGRDYRIGVKKKSAARTETTQDALSEFIRTSADMGVKVDVK